MWCSESIPRSSPFLVAVPVSRRCPGVSGLGVSHIKRMAFLSVPMFCTAVKWLKLLA
ncbi:hypothetical protein SAMN05216405_0325 [Lachnospiraceae bacterium NLAE-zl-G231]|nr:hypothetical protein SAMN05216405_0325 [Lachnospiraceae bacterium NLAE-zl-G231]